MVSAQSVPRYRVRDRSDLVQSPAPVPQWLLTVRRMAERSALTVEAPPIMISSGIAGLPEQAQAENAKERCRRAINPALGDEIEAAHWR
jgi:hypothetical protein